jgi:hypothetical protein
MSSHRFAIGQAVRLRPAFGPSPKTAEVWRIIGLLPARDNSFQYRVRSDGGGASVLWRCSRRFR